MCKYADMCKYELVYIKLQFYTIAVLQLHKYGRRPHPQPADRVNKASKGVKASRIKVCKAPMRGSA